MAQGTYAVGQEVEVTYQAKESTTGLVDVTMTIYDEGKALDLVNYPNVVLTEIGATGRYYGAFTPDAVGKWRVLVDSAAKPGKTVNQYDVVNHNLDSIGDTVDAIEAAVSDPPILV